jgi:hypothetical protein
VRVTSGARADRGEGDGAVKRGGAFVEPGGHDGVVESTDTIDQSMLPWASASARTAAKSLPHVPSADQRLSNLGQTRLQPGPLLVREISPPHGHANGSKREKSPDPPDTP